MRNIEDKIREKVTKATKIEITEKKLYDTVRKRKNWSAPTTDERTVLCRNLET